MTKGWLHCSQVSPDVFSTGPGSQSNHQIENFQVHQDGLREFQRYADAQAQQAVRRAGAQLAADPRALFICKASASSRLRAQAGAGEGLMRLVVAAVKGQVPDAEAFLGTLRKALRGFVERPGSAATRTRQHSTYATHAHAVRWDPGTNGNGLTYSDICHHSTSGIWVQQ